MNRKPNIGGFKTSAIGTGAGASAGQHASHGIGLKKYTPPSAREEPQQPQQPYVSQEPAQRYSNALPRQKYVPPSARDAPHQTASDGRYGRFQPDHSRPGQGQAGRYRPPAARIEPLEYSSPWSSEAEWYPENKRIETILFGTPSSAGINFERYDNIPVDVQGPREYLPMDDYVCAPIHEIMKRNVALQLYSTPTPIQKHGVPIAMAGYDLMACAQTGSGKTAAFMLPIFTNILAMYGPPRQQRTMSFRRVVQPLAVIMAPTRELAMQIFKECEKFAYRTWLSICVAYGGAPPIEQIQNMENGCDILVATPGRLKDFIDRGRVSLSNVRFLVLDEADRMLDMGFEPQIREIVQKTDMRPKDQRQTMMYSATFPKEIQRLARDFLKQEYVFLTIGRIGTASENIVQEILYVEENDKPAAVLDVLSHEDGQVLVFAERKIDADDLGNYLHRSGINAAIIHGDKSQDAREHSLGGFRAKKCKVLVATSVAARGLDIPDVSCVLNFDMPKEIDEYVHKIGRTGRAGNVGKAISFFNQKDARLARELVQQIEEAGQQAPEWLAAYARGPVQESRGRGRFGYRR